MESSKKSAEKPGEVVITERDILFECPACGKSLVVDERAEGLIVDCPQCHTNVIVPPKQPGSLAPPPPSPATSGALASSSAPRAEAPTKKPEEKAGTADVTPQRKLEALAGQLKEIQSQRTELTNRIASRLNEVNRDLVMMARLETSQQQILSEWNRFSQQLAAAKPADGAESKQPPTVIGSSVGSGRTRVSFRA